MGYPMTWQRVLRRNGLDDGDYTTSPTRHRANVVADGTTSTLVSEDETKLARFDDVANRVGQYEQAFRSLAGDIRRLERDAVDEGAVCRLLAQRTGFAPDAVAAVLKEFLAL
jgi:hypothetical protein